jgi:HEAT repeat protein/Flp pilus assembly protein TadD
VDGARVVLATLLSLVAIVPGTAAADWQVHRDDTRALLERAERALREQPDDDAVARRVVQLAGRAGRAALVARFRARAQQADAGYTPVAAYARLLLATGDGAAAAAAFGDALRLDPKSIPALVGRARAQAAAGAATDAIASYDEALRLEQRPAARRRLIEAELTLLVGARIQAPDAPARPDLERIIALERELAGLDPDRDAGAARLADVLEQAGRPAEAAAVLEARLPAGRAAEKLPLALRAARLRLADGDPADAARAAAALADLPRQLPVHDLERRREVWSVALAAARRRGTLAELARELGALGDRAGAAEWDALGAARDEMGDLEGAASATRAAAARAPRDPDIARRLVALLDRLGRDEEATRACEELARRSPSDPRFAAELVDRQMRRGHRDEAAAALDRAIARFGHDRNALLELATVASRWGADERALAIWQRLHRLDPANEVAIIGLGEAEFQRGRKDDARRTWAALRDRRRQAPEGHLRLAEVLLEHDFVAEATAEARRAQALEPKGVAPHRLLAQIFERDKKIEDAITEWNVVLALGGAGAERGAHDEQAGLRREARMRLLGLYARLGRGRLEAQIRKLAADAQAHPEDAEAVLFLAEAQERAGDANAAAATLRSLVARAGGATAGASPAGDVPVEAAFGLVHLLKRNGQLDEAMERLDEVTRAAPGRAREAHLQIADLALLRYETDRALDHAARAAAGADGPTLARIGEIQARAGADTAAIASYREAVTHDAGPAAALALARLYERRGDAAAAAALLDRLLVQSDDDETVVEAGRLAIDAGEVLGTLPELEQRLAERLAVRDTPAARTALVAVLKRLLPPLYRDPAGDDARARVGRQALRALLELVTDAEQPPDRAAVELIGMLGNPDAAPALARIVAAPPGGAPPSMFDTVFPPPAQTTRSPARRAQPLVTTETRLAAVIALGRLGDPRGRPALERLATTVDPSLRAAAIWSLGRAPDERAVTLLLAAIQDRRADVATAAAWGLGRAGGPRAIRALAAAAGDARQPLGVRRAAVVALGRIGGRDVTPGLFRLLDAGDEDLARAAAFALAWSRDAGAVPGLVARALLPRRFALADAGAPLAALGVALAATPPPDEARLLSSPRLDLDAALDGAPTPPPDRDLTPLLRAHARAIQDALADALARGGDARREALAALDRRSDGPGLGALAGDEDAAGGPDASAAIREIVLPLADRVAALLDDADADTRAAALRVLAKLGDERVTAARVAAAVADGSATLAAAATFAAARVAHDRPGAAPALASALAPALADESWRRRLAAVEALAPLGAPGVAALDRARNDRNPIVRAAATEATARHAIDLPAPPSRMP